MSEVSRFYGIIIRFYYHNHPPTHFPAIYAGHEALGEIESDRIYQGRLPGTACDLVSKWRLIHLAAWRENWNRARQNESVLPIEPLE
jgi:hypothetical protein